MRARAAAADPLKPITTHLGWTVDVDTFVEVDAIPWSQHSQDQVNPASGAPLNEDTIEVRRGFVRLDAKQGPVFAELELDGNTVAGPTARIVTAQVGWALPALASGDKLVAASAGLMLIPFGAEVPLNARYRVFMEQPTFLRALFPGDDDAGAHVFGSYGHVNYSLAAMNGAPVGDAQWKGVDPSSSFDFLARLGAHVELPYSGSIVAGVSALDGSGLHPGTLPTKDQIEWVDSNQDGIVEISELTVIPGQPGEPSQAFHRDALDVDLAVHWCICAIGEGRVQFEGAIAKNLDRGVIYADPIAASRDIRELGYSIDVVQDVGRYAQAGVRYDYYNADRDAHESEGVSIVQTREVFSTWAFLAAVRWDTAKLSFEYDRVRNPLGRDDAGQPATEQADRITIRGQVNF